MYQRIQTETPSNSRTFMTSMLSNYKYEVDIYYLPRTHWKRNFCFIFFTVSPKIITSANDFSIIVLNIVISVLIFVFSFIGTKIFI